VQKVKEKEKERAMPRERAIQLTKAGKRDQRRREGKEERKEPGVRSRETGGKKEKRWGRKEKRPDFSLLPSLACIISFRAGS
jgi:hypothetical protein